MYITQFTFAGVIRRTTPKMRKTQIIADSINAIKNCPCNVNTESELNPLCGTADTLDGVLHRTRLEFLPETASPCFFVHRDGDQYYIANTTDTLSRKVNINALVTAFLMVVSVNICFPYDSLTFFMAMKRNLLSR